MCLSVVHVVACTFPRPTDEDQAAQIVELVGAHVESAALCRMHMQQREESGRDSHAEGDATEGGPACTSGGEGASPTLSLTPAGSSPIRTTTVELTPTTPSAGEADAVRPPSIQYS